MTSKSINIEEAIKLVRKRKTSVDDLCKFIYKDIADYQNEREDYYFDEFKREFNYNKKTSIEEVADDHADLMIQKIERDVKLFTIGYAVASMDAVLDAINEKRFKPKRGAETLLILLDSLKQLNEEI